MVIVVTHDFLSLSHIADRLIVLARGKVVADDRCSGRVLIAGDLHSVT